jgi:hypothetical protein
VWFEPSENSIDVIHYASFPGQRKRWKWDEEISISPSDLSPKIAYLNFQ